MPGWKLDCFRSSAERKGETQEEYGLIPKRYIPEDKKGTTFVELIKPEGSSLGLTISGGLDKDDKPRISNLRAGGIAQRSDSLQIGDYIASVNGIRTANLRHDEIINLLKNCGDRIILEVIYLLPDAAPQHSYSVQSKRVEITLVKDGHSFGFTLRGGMCSDRLKCRPVTITQIRPGSSADREGSLKPGDRILAINDISVANATLMDALTILYQCELEAVLCVEYDVSVMDAVQNASGPLLVEIDHTPGTILGITLAGSVQNNKNVICVDSIIEASIADRCGALHIGDQVLSIDGTNLEYLSVNEATQLLKASPGDQISLEIIPSSQLTQRTDYSTLQSRSGMFGPGSLHGHHGNETSFMPSLVPSSYTLTPPMSGDTINRRFMDNHNNKKAMVPASSSMLPASTSYLSIHSNPAVYNSYGTLGSTSTLGVYGTTASRTSLRRQQMWQRARRPSNSSLASGATNGPSHHQVCRTESTFVVLFSTYKGFGFSLQGGVFSTEIMTEPPVIGQIEPGGSADKSGVIQEGDRLLSINGCSVDDKSVEEVRQMLREAGIKVTLEIEFEVADSIVPSSGVFNVKLRKSGSDLGIVINSSRVSKPGEHLYISEVKRGSAAYRSGTIHPGDRLLAIDNIRLEQYTADDAMQILGNCDEIVKLRIKKDENYSDDTGHVSAITYTVELQRHGGPLGITISGTEEPFDPITISGLTEGGLAARTGALHFGDRILAINNRTLRGQPLSFAIQMLQNAGETVTLRVTRPTATNTSQTRGSQNEYSDKDVMREKCGTPIPSVDSAVDSWDGSGTEAGHINNNNGGTRLQTSPKRAPSIDVMSDQQLSVNGRSSHNDSNWENVSNPSQHSGTSIDHEEWSRTLHDLKTGGQSEMLRQLENNLSQTKIQGGDVRYYSDREPTTSPRTASRDYRKNSNRSAGKNREVLTADYLLGVRKTSQRSPERSGVVEYDADERLSLDSDKADSLGQSSDRPVFNGETTQAGGSFPEYSPSPVEFHGVTLCKDAGCEDFGFGVSDGMYEKGIYVSAVRPMGPADRGGVKPFDRVLQVNNIKIHNLDCRQAVRLIAGSGSQIDLIVGRTSISSSRDNSRHNASWEQQRDELQSVRSSKTV